MQDGLMKVLAVVLQCAADQSDPKSVCTLQQVCKPWRAAVAQTVAGTVMADVQIEPTVKGLTTLTNFTAWIVQHPGLLQSIGITVKHKDIENVEHLIRAAEYMLLASLQQLQMLSAQAAQQTSAAAQQPVQPLLKLQRYSSNVVTLPSVLSHLPAHSLTSLRLDFAFGLVDSGTILPARPPQTAAFCSMLQQLSNLQDLSLTSYGGSFPNSVAETACSLGQLTRLTLSSVHHTAQLQLPAGLQHLTLGILEGGPSAANPPGAANAGNAAVQLTYLTNLQSLDLRVPAAVAGGAALPTQLTALTAKCSQAITALNIPALKQLQQLAIERSQDGPEQLLSLTSLAQLQHLALSYTDAAAAVAAALSWDRFPQLRSLKLDVDVPNPIHDSIVGSLDSLVGLTELVVHVRLLEGTDDAYNFFGCMSELTNLQTLAASWQSRNRDSHLYEQEALHLTKFKQLTHLDLFGIGAPALDDSVANALALHLTKLEWLRLSGDLSSSIMPAVGMLTRLKHLSVPELSTQESAHDGLQFLTGLTGLTHLEGFERAWDQAREDFWSIVRGADSVFDPYAYY